MMFTIFLFSLKRFTLSVNKQKEQVSRVLQHAYADIHFLHFFTNIMSLGFKGGCLEYRAIFLF